jgi:hypothetical protein
MSRPRSTRGVLAVLLVAAMVVPAVAQLSEEDIAALRERAAREGWSFTVGENGATPWPMEQLCGLVKPEGWVGSGVVMEPAPDYPLPPAFDWRNPPTGFPLGVTPIKNQAGCGSCWAFAAVGAMECSIRIADGVDVDLSEQWLVSCTAAGSCSGGWPDMAFGYMMCSTTYFDDCGDNGAVMEADFPYVAWNAPCGCPYLHPYCITGYVEVPNTLNAIKQAIYDHGPVCTTVYVDSAFQGYTGGVFDACGYGPLNHAVVLVGWDDYNGCWIMRNSWGTDWGENGYMRIKYDCSRIGENTSYVTYSSADCNSNGLPDRVDIVYGTSLDCNNNWVPDECEPDCNSNGVPDVCDLWAGTSLDCNRNDLPDECDLDGGLSNDCNTNGVPDECDLEETTSFDCNGNLIPDECELADGSESDCNTNGVLDACDMMERFWTQSSQMSPIGDGYPQQFIVDSPRDALGDVAIRVMARGDFNFTVENLEVYLNGTLEGTLLVDAFDCPVVANEDTLLVPAAVFNAAAAGGSVTIDFVPTQYVDPAACFGDTWLIVEVTYDAEALCYDCNGNSLPDECDIASGLSSDANGNGIPDECEVPVDCRGDCNCDGVVSFADIDYFVAGLSGYQSWMDLHMNGVGNPPVCSYSNCDADNNGTVSFDDIWPFIQLVGKPCTQ